MSGYRNKALFSCTVTEKSLESVQRSAGSRQLRLSPRSLRYAQQRGAGFLPLQCEVRAPRKTYERYQPPEERPNTKLEDVLWPAPLTSSLDVPGPMLSRDQRQHAQVANASCLSRSGTSMTVISDANEREIIGGDDIMGGDANVGGSGGGSNSGRDSDRGCSSGGAQTRPKTSTKTSRPPRLDATLPPRPHTSGAAAQPRHQAGSGPHQRRALALTTRRPVTPLERHWNPGQTHPSGRRAGTGQAALNPRALSVASTMQQGPRRAERRLRAWQRAEHIALSQPIERLAAPRRVRLVPANSRFKASPALFDLTTLRCIRNYYQAQTVTGKDMDERGKAYGMLPPSMPSVRLHVPS